MSTKPVRNTKKSRMIAEFAEAIVDRYIGGDNAISKSEIVAEVINNNVGAEASTTIRTMLEDELANELERYFYEAVKVALAVIDRPSHLVTKKYFRQEHVAKSKYTAQQMVCVFGNGRQGKADGIRFVPEGVTDDPLLLISLEKKIDCTNKTVATRNVQLEKDIESGAVTPAIALSMTKKLPHSG
jgi:hypothetical protein